MIRIAGSLLLWSPTIRRTSRQYSMHPSRQVGSAQAGWKANYSYCAQITKELQVFFALAPTRPPPPRAAHANADSREHADSGRWSRSHAEREEREEPKPFPKSARGSLVERNAGRTGGAKPTSRGGSERDFYTNHIQLGILIPNKVTLTRLPEESNLDTNSGMPKKLSVTVVEPSAFTFAVPSPNKLSRNASNGGGFKVGGCGEFIVEGGGGEGGGDGGAAWTLRVAALLVALPALLVKTASYSLPFKEAVTPVSVSVVEVAPLIVMKDLPPSVLTCH